MGGTGRAFGALRVVALLSLAVLAACGGHKPTRGVNRDRECMARAMYFESNRSSDEGMLAVGTVVMNRVESEKFPNTVCGVVGQKNQFAPGVLSKPMNEPKSRERALRMAEEVLRGKRHRGVGPRAMFFHTAGYNFRYNNMHYMALAGGNVFYEKRTPKGTQRNRTQREVVLAAGGNMPEHRPEPRVQLAAARSAPHPAAPARPTWEAPVPTLAVAPAPAPLSIEELILYTPQ